MQPARLAPLTSVRFFAAFAVVCFHSYLTNGGRLRERYPELMELLGPLLRRGELAVDLFFMLSGFVLAWNYLDRLGPRLRPRVVVDYLRSRLARVYPLYVAMTVFGGLVIWLRHHLYGTGSTERLNLVRFVKQLLMVQQWDEPQIRLTSWCGPAWSISCEWLAYLLLPFLALVVWRLRDRLPAAVLGVLSVLALAPLLWAIHAHGGVGFDYAWAYRILCDFTAGVLLGAAVQRARVGNRACRAADTGIVVVLGLTALWLLLAPEAWRDLVVVLWLPLLAFLALGDGPVTRLLSLRPLVVGGQLSYALYLVHGPVFKLYRDVAKDAGVPWDARPYGEMLVALGCIALAYLLMRHLEEPARRRLTRSKREPAPSGEPAAL